MTRAAEDEDIYLDGRADAEPLTAAELETVAKFGRGMATIAGALFAARTVGDCRRAYQLVCEIVDEGPALAEDSDARVVAEFSDYAFGTAAERDALASPMPAQAAILAAVDAAQLERPGLRRYSPDELAAIVDAGAGTIRADRIEPGTVTVDRIAAGSVEDSDGTLERMTAELVRDLRGARMANHICPVGECNAAVSFSKLMCSTHWRMVPKAMGDEVYAAYRRRKLPGGAAAHKKICLEAIRYVEDKLAQRALEL